jgi:type 1 glutamine amidotransferase
VGDNDILIQTANTNSIKNIAWTRKYKNSRVFCYASGHDNTTYSSEDFRRILHNGILWCANLK